MSAHNRFTRRGFMKSVAAGAGAVSVPAVLTGCFGDDSSNGHSAVFEFGHGVASGDPLADAVIIWTRVTPDSDDAGEVTVSWAVAQDEAMTDVVASGNVITDAGKDYTVKVDVTGLDAGTTYYYQFAVSDETASVVGITRTLPSGSVDSVTLAVCSCSNYPAGLFNAYREMANSDADVIVHLGDYIYEYGTGEYPTPEAQVRDPEPLAEILTLADYRARYAQYRSDTYLQLAHQRKPFICIWDDHEVANDTYKDGAENHDDSEGSFTARRDAAVQAYHEWLPIRTGEDLQKIYRTFDFGDLVSLHMLETRLLARDKQLSFAQFLNGDGSIDAAAFMAALADTNRTLTGTEQLQTVQGWMAASSATWQVLGQQVLMGRMNVPQELLLQLGEVEATLSAGGDASAAQAALGQTMGELVTIKMRMLNGDPTVSDEEAARIMAVAPYNLDAWDDYMVNREQLLGAARQLNKNTIVLAGDTHNAWANDIYPLNAEGTAIDRSVDPAAVEFATGSITSPGFERYMGFGSDQAAQQQFEMAITTMIDDLKYLNAAQRGYMTVTFTPTQASAVWNFVSTITSSDYSVTTAGPRYVQPGAGNRRIELPAS